MSDTESDENGLDYQMDAGDYIIQCHIIEGRELRGDPVVTIDVGDTKKNTSILKDRNNVSWDQVFTFNIQNKSKKELDQFKIDILVHNANTLSRNELIGSYSFDLSWIYFRKHHEYFRHWIAISHDNDITGYIKLSICVLGRNDEQFIHSKHEIMNENESIVLTNPSVAKTYYLININVFKLDDIPSKDPFVSVEFGCNKLKSKRRAKTMNIPYSFQIPVIEPIFTKYMKLTVWNHDILSKNDRIATILFNYKEIKNKYNGEIPPSYWYLYGAPNDDNIIHKIQQNNEITSQMNKGLIDGIYFKGRVLLSISIRKTERKRKQRVLDNINGLLEHELPPMRDYRLRCDLYEGLIGDYSSKFEIIKPMYYISICIANINVETKHCRCDHKRIEWNEMMDIPPIKIPQTILHNGLMANIPHVFAYLYCQIVTDISLLAYSKVSLMDIVNGNGTLRAKWIDLKENVVTNKHIGGSVLLCLNEWNDSMIDTIYKPLSHKMQLRCYIFNAKRILSADSDSLSDPFLEISFGGETAKTSVIQNSMDPNWFETVVIDCQVAMETKPSIYCQLLDEDVFMCQSLGRFQILCDEVMITYKDEDEPMDFDAIQHRAKQYPLYDDGDSYVTACFELIGTNQLHYPLLSTMNMQQIMKKRAHKMYIHIITLGIRNLNSTLYIGNPFIIFEIDGKCFETKKSKLPSKQNPNFNQHIKTEIYLPSKSKKFMPNLNISVQDSLFGGIIQRNIGYTTYYLNNDDDDDDKYDDDDDDDDIGNVRKYSSTSNEYNDDDDDERDRFSIDSEWNENVKVNISELTPLINKEEEDEYKDNEDVIYEYTKKDEYSVLNVPIPCWMEGRAVYGKELENSNIFKTKPFVSIPIYSKDSNHRNIGYFKGNIFLTKNKTLNISESKKIEKLKKEKDLYLRIYIIKCHNLTVSDESSESDPYLMINCGESLISTRNKHLNNDCNPSFYESFEFNIVMPGTSMIEISVMDFDGLGDDLIGKTSIDIEDRYFNDEWQNIYLKPIESRNLYSPQSLSPQGKIDIILDIMDPSKAKQYPLLNIKPLPPIKYELRAIIWNTKDIPISDTTTNMNDLFVTAIFNDDKQCTDTHLRCVGNASFNWRFIWNLSIPSKNYEYDNMCIRLWDQDFFSLNDAISQINLTQLKDFYHFAYKINEKNRCLSKTLKRIIFNYCGKNKFWVHCDKGKGAVKMSFELMPNTLNDIMPAAKGRNHPNRNPYLPEPKGRAKFSLLNPMQTIRNLLGDKLIGKLCGCICLIACCAFILFMLPMLVSESFANAIIP